MCSEQNSPAAAMRGAGYCGSSFTQNRIKLLEELSRTKTPNSNTTKGRSSTYNNEYVPGGGVTSSTARTTNMYYNTSAGGGRNNNFYIHKIQQ